MRDFGPGSPGRLMFNCIDFIGPEREAALRQLRYSGARTFEVDAALIEEEWQFSQEVWRLFRCARCFGYANPPGRAHNARALLDCLRAVDEDTTRAKDYLLVIRHAALFWQRFPRMAGEFTHLWLMAADTYAEVWCAGFDLLYVW